MKITSLILLLLGCSVSAFAQAYAYDYAGLPPASMWTANGTVDYETDPVGISFASDAGSFIYQPTVSGTNSNDYEVSMTMQEGYTAAVEYLRASSNALLSLSGSTGSFIAVEESGASLTVKQCVNGAITQLGSATIPNFPPMVAPLAHVTLRSVIWGTTLWVFFNNQLVYVNSTLPLTYGQPGIGGHPLSYLSYYPYILSVSIGRHDVAPPGTISQTGLRSSILPTAVSLAWQGVTDDSTGTGIGIYGYKVSRNGSTPTWVVGAASMTDNNAQANTTYTYAIKAVDFHGNESPVTTYSVTTPPANSVDPRRTGIFPTGSYWGGGGEQIDTLSGNLNFSFPLVVARGRTGWSVPVGLSYNSQNWRSDGGANWNLGTDTGFGYGWSLQVGSIAPYYAEWTSGVDHYVFTDATGASYRLDQQSGSVWYSQQGIYVWFDAAANKLYFKDGMFWVMGCTSSGGEQDAGTLYPTVIEDANGNRVIVTYKPAVLFPTGLVNTSARISIIEDVRRTESHAYQTYSFTYNTDPTTHIPHLANITNWIGTAENFPSFSYEVAPLAPPFGSSDPSYSGITTMRLTAIDVPATGPTGTGSLQTAGRYSFTYDSSPTSTPGGGELTQVTFPWGGHLRWNYSNAVYLGGRLLREVSERYVAADYGGNEWNRYTFTHTDSGAIQTVHTDTTLVDASGVGAKTWTFSTGTGVPAWEVGLTAKFQQLTASGGTPLTTDTYTWDQTPASTTGPATGRNPFLSAKTHVLYGTTSPTESALTEQLPDTFGNITEVKVYPFNVTTGTPLQDYQNTYLTPGGNMNPYMVDRLSKTTLTTGGISKTLVQNFYDGSGYSNPPGGGSCAGVLYLASNQDYDEYENLMIYLRGLVTQTVATSGKSTCFRYDGYGNVTETSASDGTTTSAYPDSTTNYAVPTALMTESYNYSFTYNTWLGLTQTTGGNGESTSLTYDSYGRPYSFKNSYTNGGLGLGYYVYPTAAALPTWQMKTAQDGITYTLLDGLGRPMQVKHGDSNGPQSYTNSVYAPCACSPLGKLQKVSQPYATSSSVAWTQPVSGDPLKWTSYTYDGIGRTLTVTQPDGISVTRYAYSGNQTTVTDPNGNWKAFTTDVLGNLITVTEPDPANPSIATLTTTYTYDWANHLASSTMTRNGTTQTRTFVYNDAGQLTSATNPESGTMTYTYNPTGTLATKHDANGQDTTFTYDAQNRVTGVSRGGNACTGISYTYGTDVSQYNYGRLIGADYGTLSQACIPGVAPTSYHEQYTYDLSGELHSKMTWINRIWTDWNGQNHTLNGAWYSAVQATYGYDSWGMPLQLLYSGNDPFNSNPPNPPTVNLRYSYDSMGRLSGMTDGPSGPVWVQGVTYDLANRITQLQYPQYSSTASFITETKTYNFNGQLESMTWTPGMAGQGAPSGSITYSYTDSTHTGNNGQVVQAIDGVSGETISYQYDALKRLLSASSSPNTGGTPAAWAQSYSYDGFGNLTGKTLGGTTAAIPVDPATNRLVNSTGVLSNVSYDSNGNLTSITNVVQAATLTMTYDGANRVASANAGAGTEYYSYDPSNRRIYRKRANGAEEWTFYGARGEKLGTYGLTLLCDDWNDPDTCLYEPALQTTNIWFGSKLIWSGTGAANTSGPVFADRLGTNRANGARFRPYGDEITTTGNDHVKFATYNRDAAAGLDYAGQRYYASAYGRFNTADQYTASAGPEDPGSWNRYAYVEGDPVNKFDPTGQFFLVPACGVGDDPCVGFVGISMGGSFLGGNDPYDGGGYAGLNPCAAIVYGLYGGSVNCAAPVIFSYYPTPSKPAPEPTCTVSAYERPLDAAPFGTSLGAAHAYLTFKSSDGTDKVFEGQQLPNHTLVAVGANFAGPPFPDGYLPSDVLKNSTPEGSISGTEICDWLNILNSDVAKINAAPPIAYSALFGPNSNTVFQFFISSLPASGWYENPRLAGAGACIPNVNCAPPRQIVSTPIRPH